MTTVVVVIDDQNDPSTAMTRTPTSADSQIGVSRGRRRIAACSRFMSTGES
jgi:hypothetical protein